MTKLENLLAFIHPAKTIEPISSRVEIALNRFLKGSISIRSFYDFKMLVTRFYCHVEMHVLNIRLSHFPDPIIYWGRCHRILCNEYGPNGITAGMDICLLGAEGGLYAVLKTIAFQLIKNYSNTEITAKVLNFWESLSVEERLAVVDEYLRKYGHLLPSELKEGNAARLRLNFIKVLIEHPYIISEMRKIGRQ